MSVLTAPPSPAPVRASRWRSPTAVLAVLAVAQFIDVLDVTIVNVALPDVQRDLGFTSRDLPWVVSAYVLTYGGFLLLGGRLADVWGRRRLFTSGLAVFGVASLLAGLAQGPAELIAIRGVQGAGAALMAPAALSLLTVAFPAGRQRDLAMGVWGGLAGLGGTLGVVAGGLLVDALSWRWVFLVNVPVVAVLVALAPVVLTESRESSQGPAPVDWRGGVLGTAGLLTVMVGVIDSGAHGWSSLRVLGELAGGALLLRVFVAVKRGAARPVLPLRLFRSRGLSRGSVMLALNGATFLAMFFLTATALQTIRHDSALATGVAFLPMGVAAILGAVAAGQLVTHVGTRTLQVSGTALSLVGLLLLAGSDPAGSYVTSLLPGLLLFGTGILLIGVPTQIATVADIAGDTAGTASGVLTAAYQIGSALGLAAISTVATSRVADRVAAGNPGGSALTSGYHLGLVIAAGLAVVNAVLALRSPSVRPTPEMLSAAGL